MLTQKSTIFAILGLFLISSLHNAMAAKAEKVTGEKSHLFASTTPTSSDEFTIGALLLRPNGSNDYGALVSPLNPNVAAPILSPSREPKGINP